MLQVIYEVAYQFKELLQAQADPAGNRSIWVFVCPSDWAKLVLERNSQERLILDYGRYFKTSFGYIMATDRLPTAEIPTGKFLCTTEPLFTTCTMDDIKPPSIVDETIIKQITHFILN